MKPYRGNAIAVGVLLIACTVSSILSAAPWARFWMGPTTWTSWREATTAWS